MAIFSRSFYNPTVAVDLGTAHTRVAWGTQPAIELPSLAGERSALRYGVVVDQGAAVAVLQPLLKAANRLGILRPCAIACVPTDVSSQEREAVVDCVRKAGAAAVFVVLEPFAAAVGAGADISSPYAHMILDIGEGVTDCAIIREGKIIATRAVRLGCSDLREAIAGTILTEWGLCVTTQEAERILRRVGVVQAPGEKEIISIAGFSGKNDTQTILRVPMNPIRRSMQPVLTAMLDGVVTLLHDIKHECGSQIIDTGLLLTGGGSLLRGMRDRVAATTLIDVAPAADPLGAVVYGARKMLPVARALKLWN